MLLAAQVEQNSVLLGRVVELDGLVAALRAQLSRDSSNSSRPPSSDSPFVKRPAAKRSMIEENGRRPGKQPGSEGTTLRLVDDPDKTVVVTPLVCGGCGSDIRDAAVFEVQRRQVVDVPPIPPRAHVSEYRVCAKTCPQCASVTAPEVPGVAGGRVQYGPRVKARSVWLACAHFLPVRRAASVVNAMLGFEVSAGFTASERAQAARLLEDDFLPAVRADRGCSGRARGRDGGARRGCAVLPARGVHRAPDRDARR